MLLRVVYSAAWERDILVMQQVRERPKGESTGRVAVETMGDRDRGDHDGESLEPNPSSSPKDNSPLFKRMTAVMHVIIFLYSAAFWVQTNVFPVGVLHASVYMCMCVHLHSHCCSHCSGLFKILVLLYVHTVCTWHSHSQYWSRMFFKSSTVDSGADSSQPSTVYAWNLTDVYSDQEL